MSGWRSALFVLLSVGARTLERGASASMYFAAGMLRLDDLRGAIANRWVDFGHDEDFVGSGLMSWERDLYDRFLKAGDRILVVGCGTGRDLLALLKQGCRAEGLDVAPETIAVTREMLAKAGFHPDLYTGRIETVELPERFDVFTFSWFCYGYIPGSAARIAALRNVAAHLNPGGRVLISYNFAEGPPRSRSMALTRFAARLTRSDWRPEPGDVVIQTPGDHRAIHYEHQFVDGELEHEARAAGLKVIFHERRNQGTVVLSDPRVDSAVPVVQVPTQGTA
jgi:SAM-dependent methyltransferase